MHFTIADQRLVGRLDRPDLYQKRLFDTPLDEVYGFSMFGLCRRILHADLADLMRCIAIETRIAWNSFNRRGFYNIPLDGNWTTLLKLYFVHDDELIREFLKRLTLDSGFTGTGFNVNKTLYALLHAVGSKDFSKANQIASKTKFRSFNTLEKQLFNSMAAVAANDSGSFGRSVISLAEAERAMVNLPPYARIIGLFAHWVTELAASVRSHEFVRSLASDNPLPWDNELFAYCRHFSFKSLFPVDETPEEIRRLVCPAV